MFETRAIITPLILTVSLSVCRAEDQPKNMNSENGGNPLLCDPQTGMCKVPGSKVATLPAAKPAAEKPVKLVYFTDPICSSCWGIEPQLRKLKLEYGKSLEIEYRMGGLLEDWNYDSGDINKPADVAKHWDEASEYYDMPIDGDLWIEDPLKSSYPSSIAFRAAQLQDQDKALLFLREIKEMVFLRKMNIGKWENLEAAARNVGLDAVQLKTDCEGKAKSLFESDLKAAEEYDVTGFPAMYFVNAAGDKEVIRGSKPYAFYEMAVLKLQPDATKSEYSKNWETLFATYPSLTGKEFSELSGTPRGESEKLLDNLVTEGSLEKLTTKNGSLWKRKASVQ